MQTMAWRFSGRLAVVVHGAKSPTNLEWQRFLTEAVEAGSSSLWRVLVVSHGGGPDGDQRKKLVQAMRSSPAPTVVMTRSALLRGITNALAFFNRSMKAVDLDEGEQAYEYLGLSGAERETARKLQTELERDLGIGGAAGAPAHS